MYSKKEKKEGSPCPTFEKFYCILNHTKLIYMEHIVKKSRYMWLYFKSTGDLKRKVRLTAIIFRRGE